MLLLLLLVLAAACTDATEEPPPPVPSGDARSGGRLVIGAESPFDDVVPAGREWSPSELQLARAIYDPLAVYDENYDIQPELARAITPNDDFTDWTIELREGIYFHDGTELDAEVVRRNLQAQRQSPFAGTLLRPIRSIYVTAPNTVHVAMRAPWATFPHILTGQPGFVARDPTVTTGSPPPLTAAVGTGPFIVRELTTERAVAEKNSAYWKEDLPRLDEVQLVVIGDDAERADALRAGRVDVILTNDPVSIAELVTPPGNERFQLVWYPQVEDPKLTISLNVQRPPFLDPVARQALASATDREAFEALGLDGRLPPARTPFSPESLWYNDVPLLPHDPPAAASAVEQYVETYGTPLSFTLVVPAEPVPLRYAAEWQRQLAEAGIAVTIVPATGDQVRDLAATGQYEAIMASMWGAWHPDWYYPAFHRAEMTPVGAPGPNVARFGTLGIDAALDLARESGELADQVDQYRNVQDEIAAGRAHLFIVRWPRVLIARDDVRDLATWLTASGKPGIATQGGTVSLVSAWLEREPPPAE